MPRQKDENIPSAKTAYAYTPKWDLWYNGLVWQAVLNVLNSYNLTEMFEAHQKGVGVAFTVVPDDLFIRRVMALYDLTALLEPDDRFRVQVSFVNRIIQGSDVEPARLPNKLEAHILFQETVRFLDRRGHVKYKPPRDVEEGEAEDEEEA